MSLHPRAQLEQTTGHKKRARNAILIQFLSPTLAVIKSAKCLGRFIQVDLLAI
jgi:hypothetical protein